MNPVLLLIYSLKIINNAMFQKQHFKVPNLFRLNILGFYGVLSLHYEHIREQEEY